MDSLSTNVWRLQVISDDCCCVDRRLKEAKEKLHCLQDLVAMVQDSPEAAQHLPDDLDALATSMQQQQQNNSAQVRHERAPF